ncbi:MAG: cytochrome c biogenesis protein ResB [Paludibacteraceae bacterium]
MKDTARKIWEQPWGFPEGFIVAGGIALTGLILQFSLGNIHPDSFSWPLNGILGAGFVLSVLIIGLAYRNRNIIRWFSGVQATVSAIAVLLLVVVIMGFTPQYSTATSNTPESSNIIEKLGFFRMTTSWMFVFECFYLLFILGLTIIRRASKKISWRDTGFYLNHLGLFAALLGGILGSADMQRLKMTVSIDEVEWRAVDDKGKVHELPVAIELDTFKIEEYPPKLVVIDNLTGQTQPEDNPESYLFEGIGKQTCLAGYDIEITDYLPHAGVVRDTAFINFVPLMMDGATTAIKVRVKHSSLPKPIEGWVSNGSYMFPYQVLYVDKKFSIAMPMQEVKRYTSKVTVYTQSGKKENAQIEVNKPFLLEDWMVYQLSYDESKGKYSEISVFELVRDPWLKVVYTGIFMLLAGALFLFIVGPKKRKS